jgi:hypothetical protein
LSEEYVARLDISMKDIVNGVDVFDGVEELFEKESSVGFCESAA